VKHTTRGRVRTRTGPGLARALRHHLDPVLTGAGFRDTVRSLAWLAVDEAAANIAEHGYHGRSGMPVWAAARQTGPGRVTVALFDRAPVPYPATRPIPDLVELARSHAKRGRGRAFIQGIAESVKHRSRRAGGNTLVLILDRDTLLKNLKENSSDAA
jgi:anti-sigma regulatory factor (Ser/Thr protein kinase)